MFEEFVDSQIIADFLKQLSGLLAPVIACLAVYIAWQQHKTNRDKLRLALYDKRYRVFDGLIELFNEIMRGKGIEGNKLFNFLAKTNDSIFLFDKDIPDYLDLIYKKAVRLNYLNQKLHHSNLPKGPERTQLAEEDADLLNWFSEQFNAATQHFKKYLTFKI